MWLSLTELAATAAAQAVITAVSGSVVLLGDTVDNLADALTAVAAGWTAIGRLLYPANPAPVRHERSIVAEGY